MQKNTKLIIFLILATILMIATRGHQNWLYSTVHLPDFTLPALIIAGVYFRHTFVALVLIITAIAIDNYAIVHQGISANCITLAYSILPFTYFAVFWVAKFISNLKIDKSLLKNSTVIVLIISLQWLIATISYYVWTATFANKGFDGFGAYLLQWSIVEIPPTAYWIVAVMLIITALNKFIPNFSVEKKLVN